MIFSFTGYSYGNNYALTQAQCNSHVCTVSNDIAKAGLATEAVGSLELAAHQPGSVGLQQTKLVLSACSTPTWFCWLAALGSVSLQHAKLFSWACRGREADVQFFWRKLQRGGDQHADGGEACSSC